MSQFTSIKDFAYQQAGTLDTSTTQAQWALDHLVGFPEKITDEDRAQMGEGYKLRFNENNPPVIYAVINGHYVLPDAEQLKSKKVEKVEIGVEYAFSFSSQEFGKLKNTNPALHAVVYGWRKRMSTYQSNAINDLIAKAKKILKKDQPTTRQSLNFVESMTKVFEAQGKSVKVKQVRGSDTTANAVQYGVAVAAFWKAYNAK